MKLLTKEIEKSLPKLYSQEKVTNPIARIKFFHPMSSWTWYVTEGEWATPENNGDYENHDFLFFGKVVGYETELGYFSLNELQSVKIHGLGIERDLYFKPCLLSECK